MTEILIFVITLCIVIALMVILMPTCVGIGDWIRRKVVNFLDRH